MKTIVLEETVTEIRRYQFEVEDDFVSNEDNVVNEAYKHQPRIKWAEVTDREFQET